MDSDRARQRVLVVLGSGGHTMEMAALMREVGPDFDYHYLVGDDDRLSRSRLPFPGPVHPVVRPSPPMSQLPARLARTMINLFQSVAVVARTRPRAVLANGPGIALWPAIVIRALGGRLVYVESAARVKRLSVTGRLLYPFASDFFVQWEPLAQSHPKAKFYGRVA